MTNDFQIYHLRGRKNKINFRHTRVCIFLQLRYFFGHPAFLRIHFSFFFFQNVFFEHCWASFCQIRTFRPFFILSVVALVEFGAHKSYMCSFLKNSRAEFRLFFSLTYSSHLRHCKLTFRERLIRFEEVFRITSAFSDSK